MLFFVLRPASVMLALAGSSMDRRQRWLASWLGIRGVGTFYYLLLAVEQAPQDVSRALAPLLLTAIVASVLVHGISASPLMGWYYTRLSARPRRGKASRPA